MKHYKLNNLYPKKKPQPNPYFCACEKPCVASGVDDTSTALYCYTCGKEINAVNILKCVYVGVSITKRRNHSENPNSSETKEPAHD